MSEKKKRGAPKGRRDVLYFCSALVDGEVVQDPMVIKDQEPDSANGSFPKEMAVSMFRDKHGVDPNVISMPVFKKQGVKKASASRKRLTIDRDNIDSYTLAEEHKKARYGSWEGLVNLCTNDEEKAFFVPINKVDADSSKKTTPPGAGIVNISDLDFLTENDEGNVENNTAV